MTKKILLINGPNLNLLGTRQPEIYGSQTLADLENMCVAHAERLGLELSTFQSNHEGAIVDAIQEARDTKTHIILNAGAYSHTSVAIRDAISGVGLPMYEVHISNIHAREGFRHFSYLTEVAKGLITGLGLQGYIAAIDAIAAE